MEFLLSMQLWIGWYARIIWFYAIFGIIMCGLIVTQHIKLNVDKRNVITAITLIVAYTIYRGPFLLDFLGYSISAMVFILLNDEDRLKCWDFIYKWFAILMIPSIIVYALYHTMGLPSLGRLQFSDNAYLPYDYVWRDNFLFYVPSVAGDWYRFNGPFNEPGHLGMMAAFMLFADGFDFKKKSTWLIVLALILTASLAGFLLGVIGYVFVRARQKRINFKFVIFSSLFLVAIYLFAVNYNNGDNVVNELIVSRLEYDEDQGIVGNNRVAGIIDVYFVSQLTDFDLLLHGYDKSTIDALYEQGKTGTGLEMWIVQYGILGVLQALLAYLVYSLLGKNRKKAILPFLFLFFVFMQRSYPYWFAWVICYIYGITKIEEECQQKKKKNYAKKQHSLLTYHTTL